MATCPNCGNEVPKKNKKCPKCKNIIPKELKDNIDKFPSIINNPKKITKEEILDEKKLDLKPIPLKVKPVKSVKKKKKVKKTTSKNNSSHLKNNIDKLKIKSTLKIIAVILLFIINIILIYNIVSTTDNTKKNNEKNNIPTKILKSNSVIGTWKTSNDGLFVFDDNSTFYWYDSYKNLSNNYYGGTYNYKKGVEALEEMGYTLEEFKNTFGENINLDHVYSMNILPTISYKGGIDISTRDLKENESWWFILIIKNDKTALGYNKTLDIRYNLIEN